MAFQTGTSTSIENLMQQLSTFLQANGWTEDYAVTGDPGTIAFSKNQSFVSFQYSETAAASGGTGAMALYQARANDTGDTADPWLSTGDSGAGVANNILSQLANGLCVNNFAGPHTSYFFFENNASPSYIHVVVEVDAGRYRHFGFGELDKVGDWTGGEYIYGQFIFPNEDDPKSVFSGFGMDSCRSQGQFQIVGSTIRIEDHVGEPDPATIWGVVHNGNGDTDRAGNARWRITGGHRYPPEFAAIYWIRASETNAFKPMAPISVKALNIATVPDQQYLLGYVADERLVNIANIDPGQIITIGGDDWYFFPWVRKRNLQDNTEESRNFGIAYRRENA